MGELLYSIPVPNKHIQRSLIDMKLILEQWRDYIIEEKGRREDEPAVKRAKKLAAIGKPDRTSWVAGADELESLGKGIMEDGEACGSNPWRNSQGEFSSASDAKVYTTGYSGDNKRQGCTKQGKWKASNGSKGSESDKKCGQDTKTGNKYSIRCKDNKKLWNEYLTEDGLIEIEPKALEAIVSKLIAREMKRMNTLDEGSDGERVRNFCNAKGFQSTEQFLKRQNAMVASAEGDLYKSKK